MARASLLLSSASRIKHGVTSRADDWEILWQEDGIDMQGRRGHREERTMMTYPS